MILRTRTHDDDIGSYVRCMSYGCGCGLSPTDKRVDVDAAERGPAALLHQALHAALAKTAVHVVTAELLEFRKPIRNMFDQRAIPVLLVRVLQTLVAPRLRPL